MTRTVVNSVFHTRQLICGKLPICLEMTIRWDSNHEPKKSTKKKTQLVMICSASLFLQDGPNKKFHRVGARRAGRSQILRSTFLAFEKTDGGPRKMSRRSVCIQNLSLKCLRILHNSINFWRCDSFYFRRNWNTMFFWVVAIDFEKF